jgi:hypothetical protein
MPKSHKLPEHLFDAYDWTNAAGELEELRTLAGDALQAYCAASSANATDNGTEPVTAYELEQLHDWLVADRSEGDS